MSAVKDRERLVRSLVRRRELLDKRLAYINAEIDKTQGLLDLIASGEMQGSPMAISQQRVRLAMEVAHQRERRGARSRSERMSYNAALTLLREHRARHPEIRDDEE